MTKRTYFFIVLIIGCVAVGQIHAKEFKSPLFPGLSQMYDDAAPSKLDRWLVKQVKKNKPPLGLIGLLNYSWKSMVGLGIGGFEAKRECIAQGIKNGYVLGIAAGLWEAKTGYVRNDLMVSPPMGQANLQQRCNYLKWRYYNAALVRGYLEALNLKQSKRRALRDKLTRHIERDRSWLPFFTHRNGHHPDFYQTYALAFVKYYVQEK